MFRYPFPRAAHPPTCIEGGLQLGRLNTTLRVRAGGWNNNHNNHYTICLVNLALADQFNRSFTTYCFGRLQHVIAAHIVRDDKVESLRSFGLLRSAGWVSSGFTNRSSRLLPPLHLNDHMLYPMATPMLFCSWSSGSTRSHSILATCESEQSHNPTDTNDLEAQVRRTLTGMMRLDYSP